jgi:formate hydrogenlyase subunit 3/multisubunit Na+/H+ antiporter MnhD subunit
VTTRRIAGAVLGVVLLLVGVVLALYGLFAILYGGDSGGNGNTYIKVSGRKIDADLAGGVALLIACLVTLAAVAVLSVSRRRRRSH